jgi:hypothetical protein
MEMTNMEAEEKTFTPKHFSAHLSHLVAVAVRSSKRMQAAVRTVENRRRKLTVLTLRILRLEVPKELVRSELPRRRDLRSQQLKRAWRAAGRPGSLRAFAKANKAAGHPWLKAKGIKLP